MDAFHLSSGDKEFNNRVDALFGSLQTAETNLESLIKDNKHEDCSDRDNPEEFPFKRPCDKVSSEEHAFKRPKGNPPAWRGRQKDKTPDYVKNPDSWTCYSIKTTKVLSDHENRHEGLKLMEELKTRRLDSETTELQSEDLPAASVESGKNKVLFSKPTVLTKSAQNDSINNEDIAGQSSEIQDRSLDAIFGGSKKLVQKEYEVGKSKIKMKSKTKKNVNIDDIDDESSNKPAKQVNLSYLQFEDEEIE